MADQRNTNQQPDINQQNEAHPSDQTKGAAAGAKTGATQQDVDLQRGGQQSDQTSGETQKGTQSGGAKP